MSQTQWNKISLYINKYRKYLIGILVSIGIFFLIILWNYFATQQFFNAVTKTSKIEKNDENFTALIKFYRKYNSSWINTKTLYVKSFSYGRFREILLIHCKKHSILINNGQWNLLLEKVKEEKNVSKEIIQMIEIQEEIYQNVVKKKPYSCVFLPQNVDYAGELLNLMVLEHMTCYDLL